MKSPNSFYPPDLSQAGMQESWNKIKKLMEDYDMQVVSTTNDQIIIIDNWRIIDTKEL